MSGAQAGMPIPVAPAQAQPQFSSSHSQPQPVGQPSHQSYGRVPQQPFRKQYPWAKPTELPAIGALFPRLPPTLLQPPGMARIAAPPPIFIEDSRSREPRLLTDEATPHCLSDLYPPAPVASAPQASTSARGPSLANLLNPPPPNVSSSPSSQTFPVTSIASLTSSPGSVYTHRKANAASLMGDILAVSEELFSPATSPCVAATSNLLQEDPSNDEAEALSEVPEITVETPKPVEAKPRRAPPPVKGKMRMAESKPTLIIDLDTDEEADGQEITMFYAKSRKGKAKQR